MADKAWKAFERRVAGSLGGVRRGADTRGPDAGKTDVIHDHWGVECKLLSRPSFGQILDACRQAETNCEEHQEPVAFVKRKNDPYGDTLVCVRLETFLKWRV